MPYTLEQLQIATSPQGYALLGEPPDRWFRASEMAEQLELDRSTVRKHYTDPMADAGLLERRASTGPGRPTNEYRVSDDGRRLYEQVARILGIPAPAHLPAAALVLVTANNADVAEALATELGQILNGRRRTEAITFEVEAP